MMARESALLYNAIMFANVHLDPRFQKLLSKRKECAVSFLKLLHLRMNGLENSVTQQQSEKEINYNESDELKKFIDEIDDQTDDIPAPRNEEIFIENLLDRFQKKGI